MSCIFSICFFCLFVCFSYWIPDPIFFFVDSVIINMILLQDTMTKERKKKEGSWILFWFLSFFLCGGGVLSVCCLFLVCAE